MASTTTISARLHCLWDQVDLFRTTAGRCRCHRTSPDAFEQLSIANDDTLLSIISQLLSRRTASRDVFDVWLLRQIKHKSVANILQEMQPMAKHRTEESLLQAQSPRCFLETDPGFSSNLLYAPKDKASLQSEMAVLVDRYRADLALNNFRP